MKNTRTVILEIIDAASGLTSDDISKKLDLTHADIRYHISSMLKAGIIKVSGFKIDGRGRPARIYRTNPELNEPGLINFIEVLLHLINSLGTEDPMKLLSSAFPINNNDALPTSSRLRKCIEVLQKYDYRPSWEATREGPKIIFHNCPYNPFLKIHPELCRMDLLLINETTGLEFVQSEKIDPDTSNPACCIFVRKLK